MKISVQVNLLGPAREAVGPLVQKFDRTAMILNLLLSKNGNLELKHAEAGFPIQTVGTHLTPVI